MTSHAYLLEIEGLITRGSRPGRASGESVGGIFEMDSSDWTNGLRYHTFDTSDTIPSIPDPTLRLRRGCAIRHPPGPGTRTPWPPSATASTAPRNPARVRPAPPNDARHVVLHPRFMGQTTSSDAARGARVYSTLDSGALAKTLARHQSRKTIRTLDDGAPSQPVSVNLSAANLTSIGERSESDPNLSAANLPGSPGSRTDPTSDEGGWAREGSEDGGSRRECVVTVRAAADEEQAGVSEEAAERASSYASAAVLNGPQAAADLRKMGLAQRSVAMVYGDTISRANQNKMVGRRAGTRRGIIRRRCHCVGH